MRTNNSLIETLLAILSGNRTVRYLKIRMYRILYQLKIRHFLNQTFLCIHKNTETTWVNS